MSTTHSPSTSPQHAGRPLDHFEQALLSDLRQVVTERAAPPEPRRRPPHRKGRRVTLGVAAAGLTAAALGYLGMGSGSAAFAVENQGDDVVVRIHELSDAPGLEAALAEHGVTAEVSYGGAERSVIAIDDEGNVSTDDVEGSAIEDTQDDVAGSGLSEQQEEVGPGDDEPARQHATAVPEVDPGAPGEDACGGPDGTDAPVSLERDGSDVVVTLDGDAITTAGMFQIVTFTGENDSQTLVASYEAGELRCGVLTTVE